MLLPIMAYQPCACAVDASQDFRCAAEIDAATATSYARFGQTEAEPRVERVARMGENYMSMFHEEARVV